MGIIEIPDEMLQAWVTTLEAAKSQVGSPVAGQLDLILRQLSQMTVVEAEATSRSRHPATGDQSGSGETERALPDVAALVAAVTDSVTPALVERVATLMVDAGSLAGRIDRTNFEQILDAVNDNAKAVVEVLRTVRELDRAGVLSGLSQGATLLQAVADSATPALAERIASVVEPLGRLADTVASPDGLELVAAAVDQSEAVKSLLAMLAQWRADGTLDAFAQLAGIIRSLQDSLSPALADRAVSWLSDVAVLSARAVDSGLFAMVSRATMAAVDSVQKAKEDSRRLTVMGLLKEISDPDVQLGLKTVLQLLRRLAYVIAG